MTLGVLVTPLTRIPGEKGEVRHALKASDAGFVGFGEAYVTEVFHGVTKGWKRHREMTMNLVVLRGSIRFVVHDGVAAETIDLSAEGTAPYARLTVPPGLWLGFHGVDLGSNLLLNLASIQHDPSEAEARELGAFPFAFADQG
ncbi:WxcM-like domain-containing protein [Methylobacterium sp. 285MFTsu5.1]|uniref:WxcM-like domain-containing protein n=1 Tax=Methylobacterium sp. 285MFTsu5.1 TaxID=1172187 RepID=UPI000373930D|nr:WxcM-like domain-containing protein [Methylobacterium sp. 285MFTsu5.1]